MLDGQIITLKKGLQYKVLKPLATGGQGSIWEVERLDNHKYYALKTVNLYEVGHSSLEENPPEKMEVLIYYAQAEIDFLSSLSDSAQHYIVPCFDYGFIEQGSYQLPSMLMPLYQQGDLALFIKQAHNKQVVLTGQQWLAWFKQLMSALQYMQDASVGGNSPVHRDIKPKNCLLDDDNELFLIDFGIVRESSNTGTTSFVYTFNYCAPEQILAQYSNAEGRSHFYITPAVDIYASAIVMHEMVAGKVRAQGQLNDRTTKGKHDYALHQLTHAVTGKVGYLGEIGGLEEEEVAYLQRRLADIFNPVSFSRKKIATKPVSGLPSYDDIGASLANLLQTMLAPWPDDRPTATEVLQQLTRIEETLQPQLTLIDLQAKQVNLHVGESLRLNVILKGKGFPLHFTWLEVYVNDQLLTHPHFATDHAGNITLMITDFEEAKDYTISVAAIVNGETHVSEVTITVTLTVEQRWLMGKREEALMLQLNELWLDEWQSEATTLRKKYELLLVLERLQQHHPDSTLLSERIKHIEHLQPEIKQDIKKKNQQNKKRYAFMLLAGLLLIVLGSVFIHSFFKTSAIDPAKQILPSMQEIVGGTFQMGCVSGEDCKDDESPVHEVNVKTFDLGVTEVTFAQWQACVDDGGCQSNPQPRDEGWGRGTRPVINVSWNDTQEYIQWLSEKTGQMYRLPTEAEWEYAARAGTTTKYWWGDGEPSCSQSDENGVHYNGGEDSDCYYKPNNQLRGTEPVASYPANPWQLYDMYGNVYEWTCSVYEEYHEGLESACTNTDDVSNTYVLRGGSWNYDQRYVRSAHRYRYTATGRYFHMGFRVVRER